VDCPTCPHCHQPIRRERFGAYFPPRKWAIIDAVAAAEDLGISCQELSLLWDPPVSRGTIKSHICQINDLLEGTDWYIRSESGVADRRLYFMRRRSRRAVA
jgi:hypothetical protein